MLGSVKDREVEGMVAMANPFNVGGLGRQLTSLAADQPVASDLDVVVVEDLVYEKFRIVGVDLEEIDGKLVAAIKVQNYD